MKNQINQKATGKRKYNRPEINLIKMDNDISVLMASANPVHDPDESIQPEHFSFNPFK